MLIRYILCGIIGLVLISSCSQSNQQLKRSVAGSYSIDDSKLIATASDTKETAFECFANIIPDNKVAVELSYKIHSQSFPNAWDITFCDNKGCHLSVPESNQLELMKISDDLKHRQLKLMVETHGIQGNGYLILLLKEQNKSTPDTLKFILQ